MAVGALLSRLGGKLPPLEEVRRERARRTLTGWCQYVDPTYVVARHHRRLIERLEAVERGECRRLIVSMPPRHGKSLTSTIRFPAWFLGRNPDKTVMVAAYGGSLAGDFSRQVRNEFGVHAPNVFGVGVDPGSSSADLWKIQGRKGVVAAGGVGGALTGKGAHLLVIDDPVKDEVDAESAIQRATKVGWYQKTARPRLAPSGAIVLVMTRWHEADLAGWLLSEAAAGSEQWETLVLPMEAEETGELLWPERFGEDYGTPEKLAVFKRSIGSRAWEALYQQRPSPTEGSLLKRGWWKTYDTPRTHETHGCDLLIQSWDMAFKGAAGSDYVVGQVLGKKGADYYLLDQVRGRWDFPETCAALIALSKKWPGAALKLVEDAANGPAVISQLKGTIDGLVPIRPEGSKEARASAVSPLLEAGNVYVPHRNIAPWIDAFLLEATAFPLGANDDQVDAFTQGLNRLRRMNGTVVDIAPAPTRPGGTRM